MSDCVCVSLKVTPASEAKIPRRRGSLQTEVSACGENVKAHVCTSRTWMHAVDMQCGMVPGVFLRQTFLYPPGETCATMHEQPLHTSSTPSRGTSGRRCEKIAIDSPFGEHEGHMGAPRSAPQTELKPLSQKDAGFESTQTAITSSVDEKP